MLSYHCYRYHSCPSSARGMSSPTRISLRYSSGLDFYPWIQLHVFTLQDIYQRTPPSWAQRTHNADFSTTVFCTPPMSPNKNLGAVNPLQRLPGDSSPLEIIIPQHLFNCPANWFDSQIAQPNAPSHCTSQLPPGRRCDTPHILLYRRLNPLPKSGRIPTSAHLALASRRGTFLSSATCLIYTHQRTWTSGAQEGLA